MRQKTGRARTGGRARAGPASDPRPSSTPTPPAADDGLFSIGRLAEATGVSSRTIRYYEELGILPVPDRSDGGTRKYPRAYRFYIEGALALKDLGFSLDEIRVIGGFALGGSGGSADDDRFSTLIREKMDALEHRIRVLYRLRGILQVQSGNDRTERLADLIQWSKDAAPGVTG